jgi:hypothetical protein
MNRVSILSGFRTVLLLIFAFAFLSIRLDLFENHVIFTEEVLRNLTNLVVVIYGILYIVELKLIVKQKDKMLAMLNTRLLQYEKSQVYSQD